MGYNRVYEECYFDTLPEEVKVKLRYIVMNAYEELGKDGAQEVANSVEESRYYTIEELGYKVNAIARAKYRVYRTENIKLEYKRKILKIMIEYREILKTNPDRFKEKKEEKKLIKAENKEKFDITDGLSSEQLKRKWKYNWK